MRPFLRWAGGKTSLLEPIFERFPISLEGFHYVEPFLGSGAVFFELQKRNSACRGYVLADANEQLINCYKQLAAHGGDVLDVLAPFAEIGEPELEYYAIRERYNRYRGLMVKRIEQAAFFLYLNRTCFNGIYRENRAGEFNVPWGRRSFDLEREDLDAVQKALTDGHLLTELVATRCDALLADVLDAHQKSPCFIYADPPYAETFSGYTAAGFDEHDRAALYSQLRDAIGRGHRFLLSEGACVSSGRLVQELFETLVVEEALSSPTGFVSDGRFGCAVVRVRQNVAAQAQNRGTRDELLFWSI